MMNASARQALQHYAKVGTHSGVEAASPHRLIQMLMDGGLARLAAAAVHMRSGEAAEKGACIGLAISIIGGLQSSLDAAEGGEVAANLDRLYDYMVRTLVAAHIENDVTKVEHVHRLLAEIKAGWDGLSEPAGSGATPGARPTVAGASA